MTARESRNGDRAELAAVLETNPVFRSGSPAALATLVKAAVPLVYRPGSFLFRQGEPAAHVFVITAGEVAIISPARGGAEQVHNVLGPGTLLGELALLTDGRRTAGARAASRTVAWAIGREVFWEFLEATPSAPLALLRLVAERLAAREALIDDLLSLDVKGRLAKALLDLADRYGKPSPHGGILVDLRLTHRDLAGMVGASRENVSRTLAAFRRRGLVGYGTDTYHLLDPDGLRRFT